MMSRRTPGEPGSSALFAAGDTVKLDVIVCRGEEADGARRRETGPQISEGRSRDALERESTSEVIRDELQ